MGRHVQFEFATESKEQHLAASALLIHLIKGPLGTWCRWWLYPEDGNSLAIPTTTSQEGFSLFDSPPLHHTADGGPSFKLMSTLFIPMQLDHRGNDLGNKISNNKVTWIS